MPRVSLITKLVFASALDPNRCFNQDAGTLPGPASRLENGRIGAHPLGASPNEALASCQLDGPYNLIGMIPRRGGDGALIFKLRKVLMMARRVSPSSDIGNIIAEYISKFKYLFLKLLRSGNHQG